MSTSAYIVTTAFDTQLMGQVERSADQPLIEWDWNIFPKSAGLQVINVGVELRWTPTGKSGGTAILRQIWESPIAIQVNKPFIDVGQLSLTTVTSGVVGTVFTGFSLPWILERRRQISEDKKKKDVKFCRYCGAENPKDFAFCNRCGKQSTTLTGATISTLPIPSSPGLTGDAQSSVGNTVIVQENPALDSSKKDGK
jgi:ribosomal protein L40E